MENGKTKAFINLIISVILTVNMGLTLAGKNPIPFDEGAFTSCASCILAGLSIVWSWWKDNDVTKKAQNIKKAGKEAIANSNTEGE